MKKSILSLTVLFLLFQSSLWAAPPSRVVLLGGSSVLTSYLPEESTETATLQRALDARYGEGAAVVENWADNGEFIARFLLSGKYEKFRTKSEGVDVFIIRFGTNDAKRMLPKEFGQQLEKLLDLLHADFPEAKFILGDGLYLDFPDHYTKDRNLEQQPFWEQTRAVAQNRKIPLMPLFEASKKETLNGNWDLRIRSQRDKTITLDASKDAEFPGDVDWFTDIHPNAAGVKVAVDTEMAVLKSSFPKNLPKGGTKAERPAKHTEDYVRILNFDPERLKKRLMVNPDSFQLPVQ